MDSVTVAKFLSAPTAFLLSGYSASFSQTTVPLLYDKPSAVSTPVFNGVFYGGGAVVVPGSVISVLASGYLAYVFPEQRTLFGTAVVLTLAPPIFTRLVMFKGISRLVEISQNALEQAKADQSGEATQLLQAWVAQNWVRAAMSLAGGLVAMWAIQGIKGDAGKLKQ